MQTESEKNRPPNGRYQEKQDQSFPPSPRETQAEPLIRLRKVVKVYNSSAGEVNALRGIDLDVYPGEFLGILGKSGSGKTTLVNMITGIDHLTSGEVWVDSLPVHELSENELALWRGRNLGIVYQSFQLMNSLNLVHNVMLPMDFGGTFHSSRSPDRSLELLRQVELEEHAYKLPTAISGGQQQRVAIARALANDPPILVADEPTGRLDSATAEVIFEILQSLVERGKTIVMVTHDSSLAQRVSRAVQMVDGELFVESIRNPGNQADE